MFKKIVPSKLNFTILHEMFGDISESREIGFYQTLWSGNPTTLVHIEWNKNYVWEHLIVAKSGLQNLKFFQKFVKIKV